MHFCSDELMVLLAAIPVIGLYFLKLKTWWHIKFNHNANECHSSHHNCLLSLPILRWQVFSKSTGICYGVFEATSATLALQAFANTVIEKQPWHSLLLFNEENFNVVEEK
jgi:hypothetical protein